MTQLRVLGRYRTADVSYEAGQVLDLKDEAAAYLMRDSPSSFEVIVPKAGKVATETTASGLEAPDRRAREGRTR